MGVGTKEVRAIPAKDAYDLLLNVHYAGRIPSISFAFGLFVDDALEGVCTFGTPASSPVRKGLLGPELASRVLELNRLCLRSNEQNHNDGVYQASNFLYCGLSAKRTDWKIEGLEHVHNQTIVDMFKGCENRAAAARAQFGDKFKLVERSRKHRYVYLTGGKKDRELLRNSLKYHVLPYPKDLV